MAQHSVVETQEVRPTAPPGINLKVLESLVNHLSSGLGLVDSPSARNNVAATLDQVGHEASHDVFAHVWDTLFRALSNPKAGGCHRKAVIGFLKNHETRRLQLLRVVSQHSRSSIEISYALKVSQGLALGTFNAEHLQQARNLAAALRERLLPTSLKTVEGGEPFTELFAPAHQTKYFANVDGVAGPVLLREIQGDAPRSPRYVLGETFAFGTYGALRVAMDEDGELHAVKVLRLNDTERTQPTDVSEKLDVHREIRAAHSAGSKLAPTNVLLVNDKAFVFTPLMGGDMLYMLADVGQHALYPALVRKMLLDVAGDVKRCHDAGILHRDIKLQNILYNDAGVMALGDFGLHHVGLTCKVDRKYPMGSRGYMAPELLLPEAPTDTYGPKAEVFSLGLCLVYMYLRNANDMPFYHAGDLASMRMAVATWRTWVTARSHPGRLGTLQWNAMREKAHPLDALALGFYDRDAELCTYVFEQMLQLNPDRRPAMHAVIDQARHLFKRFAPLTANLGILLGQVAGRNKKLSAAIHALRQHRARRTVPIQPLLPQA